MEPWHYGMMNRKGQKRQKKKIPKNAFYFFMLEYNEKYLEGKMNDFRKLQELVGDQWQRMGIEERRPYEVKANKVRNNCVDERLNHGGTSINDLTQREDEKREMLRLAIDDIHRIISSLDAETTLQTTEFYFFHANSHVRTVQGIVVPCEVALCRYTLKDGVIEVFNRITYIREIPLGYASFAKEISEATHRIPAPALDGERDAKKLYLGMLQFLLPRTRIGDDLHNISHLHFPAVYTVKSVAELAKECLGAIVVQCYPPEPNDDQSIPVFNVYPIEELLHNITKKIVSSVKLGNEEVVEEAMITRFADNSSFVYSKFFNDTYTQSPNIACKFHEEVDCREFCSKSCVTRMGYIISETCCNILGINRKIWHHYPSNHVVQLRKTAPIFLNRKLSNDPSAHYDAPAPHENFQPFVEDVYAEQIEFGVPEVHEPKYPIHSPYVKDEHKIDPIADIKPPTLPHRATVKPDRGWNDFIPPPTSSVLSDEEDENDTVSVTSMSCISDFKFALDTSRMSWGGPKSKAVKTESALSHVERSEPSMSEGHSFNSRESMIQAAADSFRIDKQPDMQSFINRVKAPVNIETDTEADTTETESLASLPLDRYQRRRNFSMETMGQVNPRRSRQYYNVTEDEADRAAMMLNEIERSANAAKQSGQQYPMTSTPQHLEDSQSSSLYTPAQYYGSPLQSPTMQTSYNLMPPLPQQMVTPVHQLDNYRGVKVEPETRSQANGSPFSAHPNMPEGKPSSQNSCKRGKDEPEKEDAKKLCPFTRDLKDVKDIKPKYLPIQKADTDETKVKVEVEDENEMVDSVVFEYPQSE